MKSAFEKELEKAKQEMEELEKEWERLDSQAQVEKQIIISRKIAKLQKFIDSLEFVIEFKK